MSEDLEPPKSDLNELNGAYYDGAADLVNSVIFPN